MTGACDLYRNGSVWYIVTVELEHDWRIIIESQEKVDAYSAPDYINKEDIYLKSVYWTPTMYHAVWRGAHSQMGERNTK